MGLLHDIQCYLYNDKQHFDLIREYQPAQHHDYVHGIIFEKFT